VDGLDVGDEAEDCFIYSELDSDSATSSGTMDQNQSATTSMIPRRSPNIDDDDLDLDLDPAVPAASQFSGCVQRLAASHCSCSRPTR